MTINQPYISIIIPCKSIDYYVRKCIEKCRELEYENYEIILLPDEVTNEKFEKVRVISTGPLTPGAKRNIGLFNSAGEICAFIDSDAYPRKDWLKNAIKYFKDRDVAAVGGPGLTPNEDSFMQKASGFVLSSFMVGGLSRRYKSKKASISDDIHSCNFIARRSILLDVGGWNEKYWPGEDTLICMAIKKLGKKMIEAPDVVVYHHRRPLFKKHLRQVSNYGLHRGFFAKKFKGNSLRPQYFMPSFLVFSGFVGGALSLISKLLFLTFLIAIICYITLCLIASLIEVKNLKMVLVVWLGIILTHLFYGMSFIIGFFKGDLKR